LGARQTNLLPILFQLWDYDDYSLLAAALFLSWACTM
jgi:hypothetical protein